MMSAIAPRSWRVVAAVLLVVVGRGSIAAEPNQLTPEQIADGWISLFDGETLFGWQPTSNANWTVEDGEIHVSSGEQGFLMTTSEFADYALHVEFKAPASTNSGVFLRTPLAPADPANNCIELNIAPQDNPFPTGSFVGRNKAAGILLPGSSGRSPADPLPWWDGNWHSFDVELEGSRATVFVDGDIVLRSDAIASPLRGRIGLQFREGAVSFRKVCLKPYGLKPMLNGNDLAGWRTDQTRESKFTIRNPSGSLPLEGRVGEGGEAGTRSNPPSLTLPAEGRGPDGLQLGAELHVTSGPGELETEASYGDFVMQLECFVDGDGLNSGVFFRSIPCDYANGYESQIQNAVKDGDPTKPVDAGTGAIYRRTTARRVVSKDREWLTKTIVATGPHIAVWVNGEQVTDWTDDRPPHENPRNGQRLKPGTVSLQGHDPTTNLRFRNLRIAELPLGAD
jgi:hypothetical protein